jgi:Domain of unknown function (DUF1707)
VASRLSDRERERLFDELARQAAAGRLEMAELERRVARITAAETREEAAEVFADLPSADLPDFGRPASETARPRRGAGHGEAGTPEPDWQPTSERFRDPRSGRIMRVWIDSAGARHYVAEP